MAKVMLSLPQELLKEIDQSAMAEHRSRSEFVREAVRSYLEEKRSSPRPIDNPRVKSAYQHIISHPIRWSGNLDSTQILREMRNQRYGK